LCCADARDGACLRINAMTYDPNKKQRESVALFFIDGGYRVGMSRAARQIILPIA
jgi:hypothetical protein